MIALTSVIHGRFHSWQFPWLVNLAGGFTNVSCCEPVTRNPQILMVTRVPYQLHIYAGYKRCYHSARLTGRWYCFQCVDHWSGSNRYQQASNNQHGTHASDKVSASNKYRPRSSNRVLFTSAQRFSSLSRLDSGIVPEPLSTQNQQPWNVDQQLRSRTKRAKS